MAIYKLNFFIVLVLSLLMACGSEGPKPTQKAQTAETKKAEIQKSSTSEVKSQEMVKVEADKVAESNKIASDKNKPVEEQQDEGVSPEQLKKAKEIIKGVKKKEIAEVDSKKKFKMHCATCHGFKGNMSINGAKKLTASKIPLEESVAQLYFGKGLMTPFKDILSEAEIVAVAKYIEGFRK